MGLLGPLQFLRLLLNPYCFFASAKAFVFIIYLDSNLVVICFKHAGKRALFVLFLGASWNTLQFVPSLKFDKSIFVLSGTI